MNAGMPRLDATLHDLIRHMPFPLVLYGTAPDCIFANARFAEVFASDEADSLELRRLTPTPERGWRTVELRQRDRNKTTARAQAIEVPDGVLVVIDEAQRPQFADEHKRLRQRIAELESLSATDRLTGAWNRVQLERTVASEISRAVRLDQPVSLVLIDIDRFKRINDAHGHLGGDDLLRAFVRRVGGRMRSTDSLFRWGGDEFIVLAIGVGHRGAAVLAENLREAIAAEPFITAGSITASLGVAEYMDMESPESWFERTDAALYAAKANGRNQIHVDRRGTSDIAADRAGMSLLRLNWQEAYECGEPTIDTEHRELFALGNALIAAAFEQDAAPEAWQAALDSLLALVVLHFPA